LVVSLEVVWGNAESKSVVVSTSNSCEDDFDVDGLVVTRKWGREDWLVVVANGERNLSPDANEVEGESNYSRLSVGFRRKLVAKDTVTIKATKSWNTLNVLNAWLGVSGSETVSGWAVTDEGKNELDVSSNTVFIVIVIVVAVVRVSSIAVSFSTF